VVACWPGAEDLVQTFKGYLQGKGRHVYYVFDNFTALRPLLGGGEALTGFFLELCPLLYQLETIAIPLGEFP